ncbi:hypothetical protein ACWD33_26015 [Streptomyces xiamenensis]
MDLTWHAFQRLGAYAAAELLGRSGPSEIAEPDLGTLAGMIAEHAQMAGMAEKGGRGWAWLLQLAPMFPQAPPTHPSRVKALRRIDERVVEFLMEPDDPGSATPCWACGRPATPRWSKSLWPLAEPAREINNSRDRLPGVPVCRWCRVAVWCLPYAVAFSRGRIIHVESTDEVEEAWARSNTRLSLEAIRDGWADWAEGTDPFHTVWDVIRPSGSGVLISSWVNDNRPVKTRMTRWQLSAAGSAWLIVALERGYGPLLEQLARVRPRCTHLLFLAMQDDEELWDRVGAMPSPGPYLPLISALRAAYQDPSMSAVEAALPPRLLS